MAEANYQHKPIAYRALELGSRVMVLGYNVNLQGEENIPQNTPWVGCIYPHIYRTPQIIDPFLLAGAVKTLREQPYPAVFTITRKLSRYLTAVGIPNLVATRALDEGNAAQRALANRREFLDQGAKVLSQGGIVMGYPAGKWDYREKYPTAEPELKHGLFGLAQENGVPVVPLSVYTPYDFYSLKTIVARRERPTAHIIFGQPRTIPYIEDDTPGNKAQRLTVMETFSAFYTEVRDSIIGQNNITEG